MEPRADLQVPWVHSPFFAAELAERIADPVLRERARTFAEDGFLVLEGFFDGALLDRVREQVTPLFDDAVAEGPRSRGRVQDAWRECPAVREVACDARLLDLLSALYGRPAFPFQTLDFRYGTQQRGHSDRSHFDSLPGNFMCGVWVALEDIGPDSGPLFYVPGSHRLPSLSNDDLHLGYRNPVRAASGGREDERRLAAEGFLDRLVAGAGLLKAELTVKKGTALVWAAGLVHGGSPVRRPGSTRWSQVTHYYFRDCIYVTPMYGNATLGDVYLREVTDVTTGEPVPHRYYDLEVQGFGGNGLYKLLLDVEGEGGEERDVLRAIPPRELRAIEEERDLLRVNVRDYRRIVDGLAGSASYRLGRALTAPLRLLGRRAHDPPPG
jgi:hypothetical protein